MCGHCVWHCQCQPERASHRRPSDRVPVRVGVDVADSGDCVGSAVPVDDADADPVADSDAVPVTDADDELVADADGVRVSAAHRGAAASSSAASASAPRTPGRHRRDGGRISRVLCGAVSAGAGRGERGSARSGAGVGEGGRRGRRGEPGR